MLWESENRTKEETEQQQPTGHLRACEIIEQAELLNEQAGSKYQHAKQTVGTAGGLIANGSLDGKTAQDGN